MVSICRGFPGIYKRQRNEMQSRIAERALKRLISLWYASPREDWSRARSYSPMEVKSPLLVGWISILEDEGRSIIRESAYSPDARGHGARMSRRTIGNSIAFFGTCSSSAVAAVAHRQRDCSRIYELLIRQCDSYSSHDVWRIESTEPD